MFKALFPASLISILVLGPIAPLDAHNALVADQNVSFISQGVTLRGTVYMPVDVPAFAAAVWVDGAGETRRNSGLGRFLARRGIALLTYDKRGVGKSGGVYAGGEVGTNNVSLQNITLLADDAAAALQSLRTERELHGVPVGFIGGSQAGWIIPLAALKNRQARFMVLWSGAVETTHEDVLFEQIALRDLGFWHHHTDEQAQKIMTGLQDNMSWANFDPRKALSRLTIPGLWIFGGRDRNVNVELSIERLNGVIAAGHPDYSYRLFPNYDHGLGGGPEIGIDEPSGVDIVDHSVAWIRQVTGDLSRSCAHRGSQRMSSRRS